MAFGRYDQRTVAKRPVRLPELGQYLRGLREQRKWAQKQAVDMALRRGLTVPYQALRGLEEGTTNNPEPELLRAVAALYKISYEEVAAAFFKERYGIVIGNAAAEANIRTLEKRVDIAVDQVTAYEVLFTRAHALVEELHSVTAAGIKKPEGKAPRPARHVGRRPT